MAYNLPINTVITVKANLLDANGKAVQGPVTWSISSGSTVTITPAGDITIPAGNPYICQIKGISNGNSTVTATCGMVTGNFPITVYTPAVASINVALA